MKKIRLAIAFLVMGLLVINDCAVAQAAESDLMIESRGLEIRELSRAEMSAMATETPFDMMNIEESESTLATTASYTAYEYSEIFDFSLGETWVASAEARCIVWHYTDGKVHLYQRTITVTRLATYDAGRTYGRIVNTDGSLSYTTGDRVHLYGLTSTWDFAIDFRVTPTEASFNCYEV